MSDIQHLKASFHIYLDYVRERTDMEDIHKLRVTIRKLKVLYALIEFSLPADFSKIDYNEPLTELFGWAGRVRENQINMLHVQKHGLKYLQPYLDYQSRALKRNVRNLKKSIADFEVEKLDEQCESVMNLLARFDDQWCLGKIVDCTSYKYEKIALLKTTSEDEVVLHKVRKRVRSIIDILSLLRKNERQSLPVPFIKIRQVNDKLGQWHDQVVLIQSLKSFAKRYADKLKKKLWEDFIHRKEQKAEHANHLIVVILGEWK